jgi:hypothetical protein
LGLRAAFGLAGAASGFAASGSGCASSPIPWIRVQMRLAQRSLAAFRSGRFFRATTPGRLFQVATRRSAGQALVSSVNSCWLVKVSNGVVLAAAASSGLANTLMLFSASIVNVFILNLLVCCASFAVNT